MDPLKMYVLLKMGIFQPAMLIYKRVCSWNLEPETSICIYMGGFQLDDEPNLYSQEMVV